MKHKERLAYFSETVEIYPIAPLYVLIIYQVRGSILDVPYKSLELHLSYMPHFLYFMDVLIRSLKRTIHVQLMSSRRNYAANVSIFVLLLWPLVSLPYIYIHALYLTLM